MGNRNVVSLQFCLGVKNWGKFVHVCLCLKRPAAIHKGQRLSLCLFRGIFSFTHQCFFFKIRGNHDHLSFFCCLSFFLSLVHQLVIVADCDHSMFVVQRHPGGQAADRTSSLEHKSFHKHLNVFLQSSPSISQPFIVCLCILLLQRILNIVGQVYRKSGSSDRTSEQTQWLFLNTHKHHQSNHTHSPLSFSFIVISLLFGWLSYSEQSITELCMISLVVGSSTHFNTFAQTLMHTLITY